MTESEFLEIINLHASNAITSFTVLVTYLFGYITGAYIVGSKLSRLQVIVISILYIFASCVWIVSTLTHADSFTTLVAAHPSYVPSRFWNLPWTILSASAGVSALMASLYFMYDVRTGGGEPNA